MLRIFQIQKQTKLCFVFFCFHFNFFINKSFLLTSGLRNLSHFLPNKYKFCQLVWDNPPCSLLFLEFILSEMFLHLNAEDKSRLLHQCQENDFWLWLVFIKKLKIISSHWRIVFYSTEIRFKCWIKGRLVKTWWGGFWSGRVTRLPGVLSSSLFGVILSFSVFPPRK